MNGLVTQAFSLGWYISGLWPWGVLDDGCKAKIDWEVFMWWFGW
jgi:hypothetical protein